MPAKSHQPLADELQALSDAGIELQPYRPGHDVQDLITDTESFPSCSFPHPNQPPELWPQHVPALKLFLAMQTQWRVGMAGATGLDYAAAPAVMTEALGLQDPTLRAIAFVGMQVFEREYLAAMAKGRKP